jgi:hypothetical protein
MNLRLCTLVVMLGWLLVGCFRADALNDPFGAYDAQVRIEERRAASHETVARYERDAQIAASENDAWAKVHTARTWSWTLPIFAVIVSASVVGVVYIRWNGKVTIARLRYGYLPHAPMEARGLSQAQPEPPTLEELQTLAASRNQRVKLVSSIALLIDKETGEVIKRRRLLEG